LQFPNEPKPRSLPVEVGKVIPARPDGTSVEVLKYIPHFMMKGSQIYSASDKPANPAIQVRVTGPSGEETRWLFVKYPDVHSQSTYDNGPAMRYIQSQGSVEAYESRVTISGEPGREPRTASILVNQPLRAGRYRLYQASYDLATEQSSTLEVAYDPGVPLVFIGFILMPLGMAFVFYVQPFLKGRRRAQPDGKGDSAQAVAGSQPVTSDRIVSGS
jgi:hypothetical protein